MDASLPTLTYFAIHAKADPIRMLLSKAGCAYNDEQLTFESFGPMKAAGRFPNGQVPMWMTPEGAVHTQAWAILRMLGRQHGFYDGANAEESYIVDWVLETSLDLQQQKVYMTQLRPDDNEETNAASTVNFTKWHDQIVKKLTDGGKDFIAGDRLTIADMVILSHYLCLAINPACELPCVAARAAVVNGSEIVTAYLERCKVQLADFMAIRGSFPC